MVVMSGTPGEGVALLHYGRGTFSCSRTACSTDYHTLHTVSTDSSKSGNTMASDALSSSMNANSYKKY